MNAIILQGVSKSYRYYDRPGDRFWELVTRRKTYRERCALHTLDLEVGQGEVLGVIGANGAGKSTLLKLIAGTLPPSTGSVQVNGRICALLELGAGFHPEMTGRDNIFLGGAVAGIPNAQLAEMVDPIIDFAGIRQAIDQPVKTYSSGMCMRLAFSVATAVDPDILILDETLSVGDGAFARKSFQRIMSFKEAGKTILFCSHSIYQVQAVCSRTIWIDQGNVRMLGDPGLVSSAYNDFLGLNEVNSAAGIAYPEIEDGEKEQQTRPNPDSAIREVAVFADNRSGQRLKLVSGQSDLKIRVGFQSDPDDRPPNVGITITSGAGIPVTSSGTHVDRVNPLRKENGYGEVELCFPKLPLLQGIYWVNVFLLCNEGIRFLDKATLVAELEVSQTTLEIGVVALPHSWKGIEPE